MVSGRFALIGDVVPDKPNSALGSASLRETQGNAYRQLLSRKLSAQAIQTSALGAEHD
jgi:hypothetical protein